MTNIRPHIPPRRRAHTEARHREADQGPRRIAGWARFAGILLGFVIVLAGAAALTFLVTVLAVPAAPTYRGTPAPIPAPAPQEVPRVPRLP